ncbi:hypothetical protein O3684_08705 [Pauljensenia sp. 20925_1_27]
MEWVDFFAKCFGALVALGTFLKVGAELYAKLRNGSEFGLWFGRRRKMKGLRYASVFQKRGALSSKNETLNSVKKNLTFEIAKDLIHSYILDKRASRFSRNTRDQLVALIIAFLVFVILTSITALQKIVTPVPEKQQFIDAAIYLLWCSAYAFLGMLLMVMVLLYWRLGCDIRSAAAALRYNVERVPLAAIPYCVEQGKDYIFLDATIRKRHQVPFMGTTDRVQMLLDHGAMTDEVATLQKSEAKQIKADDYDEVAGQLVDSFLSKASIRDSELVCFVFSQAGISAVLVTQLLQSKGLRAFYIGQTNGCQSEVRETIREIRMLRESGLI